MTDDKKLTEKIQKVGKTDKKTPHGEGKNVYLTLEEEGKLKEKFGSAGALERINALSLYKGSKGKKYQSDYLTILNWERMHQQEGKQDTQSYQSRKAGRVPSKSDLDEQERRFFG